MPFCPICRYEYREGIEVCPDCDAKLVPKLEPEHISRSLKKAYTTNSPAMAEMIQEMLEEDCRLFIRFPVKREICKNFLVQWLPIFKFHFFPRFQVPLYR